MAVRAKMKCESKEPIGGVEGGGTVRLYPVINGSPENEQFYKWTPGGSLVLSTINQSACDRFEVGKEYYVDVTPAAQPEDSKPEACEERAMKFSEGGIGVGVALARDPNSGASMKVIGLSIPKDVQVNADPEHEDNFDTVFIPVDVAKALLIDLTDAVESITHGKPWP